MNKYTSRVSKKWLSILILVTLVLASLGSGQAALAKGESDNRIAAMTITSTQIEWTPQVEYASLTLTIVGPGGLRYRQEFGAGSVPGFGLMDTSKRSYPDGIYTYELVVTPILDAQTLAALRAARQSGSTSPEVPRLVQSGYFSIQDGAFVTGTVPASNWDRDSQVALNDVVHADDVIITGSECVGFDCLTDGTENFGFDTIKLKENNLQIYFDDTSATAGFPANDWRIVVNDSSSGGGNYFAIHDVTGAKVPFRIEAGARTSALYVSSTGRVGLGTATPVLDLHIVRGDSPSIRLDQDASSGWTAQTWDLAGNESNFFVRDVTGGSKLPFRIQPGTPTNALTLKNTGNVGIGTWSPEYPLEIERTGSNAELVLDRTDGAKVSIATTTTRGQIGTLTNHPWFMMANNITLLKLLPTQEAGTGAQVVVVGTQRVSGNLYVNGAINPSSDVNVKENFASVNGQEILARLADIPVLMWTYKDDQSAARHMGPTAQDFYAAFGLGLDDKHISTIDADGVALAAIQELNVQNQALQKENATLKAQVNNLENRMAALEALTSSGKTPVTTSNLLLSLVILLAVLTLAVGTVRVVRQKRVA